MAVWTNEPAQMRPAPSMGTILHYGASAASLALVAIIAIWGVRLAVRDVSGVPVVRAAAGAMRVSPDAPGGEVSPDLGLAVNAIAAVGEAEGPEDVLFLAPSQPQLTQEDLEVQPGAEAGEIVAAGAALSPTADPAADPAPAAAPEVTATDINALIASIVTGDAPAAPLDEAEPMPDELDEAALVAMPAPESAIIAPTPPAAPPVVQRRRPFARPATDAVAPAATAISGFAAEAPAGAQIVQLGAFPTPDLAQSEWARVQTLASPYLAGKTPFIQQAQSSGGTFYRLRAFGFADEAEARGFCNAFEGLNLNCITVAQR